ncbi:hypothetical protein I5G05_03560 [Pseudomonas aeruginosa]|uniref:alpha/beta hydrolase n=1 Tax=Pseudomonas aeruginosa TaxID=287 RepID=UPI000AD2CB35|nr:alpha/beta hydrolase [Pseudomonas aeruginosa]MBG5186500.1 hypothetical protein [Pseudomonas aeruginosa]MDF5799858.1 hypothetical protein [Pseudomonas aeruginosa]MDF5809977.1 hypothetical protein [Pseudomonas aeruginosa]MDF5889607.1 hypothetical protein [Pseudomonas aeruginosa]MDF5916402.1 hypothetical protein [Pseudomonas aeruginosa]
MNHTEIISLVEQLWSSTLPEKRRETFKLLRSTIPADSLSLFDALVDNKRNGIHDCSDSRVLILIHGIHTDGSWHQHVQAKLSDIKNLQVQDLGYDLVTALQLFGPFRRGPIERIVREIRNIKREEPLAKISVIAHSFGTYITSKILQDHPDIVFDKIIMCGSIVSRDYPWNRNARGMNKSSIINDVGTRDIWPLVATCTTLGYGSTGRRGFQSSCVTDRYFNYAHSDFFEEKNDHITKYWRPIFEHNAIKSSDWDTKKPKAGLSVLIFSHPLLGRLLVATFIAGVILALFCYSNG